MECSRFSVNVLGPGMARGVPAVALCLGAGACCESPRILPLLCFGLSRGLVLWDTLSSFWVEQSQEMFCRSSSSVFKLQIDIQLTGRDQSLGEQTSPPGAQRRCRIPSSSCSALPVPRFCAARWRSSACGARLKAHRWSGSQAEAQG